MKTLYITLIILCASLNTGNADELVGVKTSSPQISPPQIQSYYGKMMIPPKVSDDQITKCQDMVDFLTQQKQDPHYKGDDGKPLPPFLSDGVLIMKDGKPVFKWHDDVMPEGSKHVLWSASKMISATLLERAINDGYTVNGKLSKDDPTGEPLSFDTKLSKFFPNTDYLKAHPEMADNYNKITLRHLVEMSANFDWQEYYTEDMSNSKFLPMLYFENGINDMANFASQTPINPEGPGHRWVYSGGNANILMGVLKKIFGENYNEMPGKLLFEPLGIKDWRFERDKSGTKVGSSYAYLSLDDMAKLGQLYLDNGKTSNGKQLLSQDWINSCKNVAPAVYDRHTSFSEIKAEGAASGCVFWLNKNITRDDGTFGIDPETKKPILYPQEMPEAPNDMFVAAGHYGQLIIIIPSQKLVIATTGYNTSYWSHLMPIAVKAGLCFDKSFKPNYVNDNWIPPSAGNKKTFFESLEEKLQGLPGQLKTLKFAKENDLAARVVAKEMCSFLFVMGAINTLLPDDYYDEFKKRSGMPANAKKILLDNVKLKKVVNDPKWGKYVTMKSAHLLPYPHYREFTAKLEDDPHAGCVLLGK